MLNNKILFIVEGETDEVSFLQRLYSQCYPNQEYDIYSYKTNIHVLSQILFTEYPDFDVDEIDIRLVLKSKEMDPAKRSILENKYRDIFLIFDFEPQHDKPHFDTVKRMIEYFDDSTDHGKIFINYPMMQSYKDFEYLPDDKFAKRVISVSDVPEYKRIVGARSKYTDVSKYDYHMFVSLAVHHIRKCNYILSGNYQMPTKEEYLSWSGKEIYEYQYDQLKNKNLVSILNTAIFLMIDYKPTHFFRAVQTRSSEFLI